MKHIKEVLDKKPNNQRAKKVSSKNVKHTIVFKNLLENAGKGGVGKAMKDAGYSPGYTKNPQDFTKGKAWSSLVKEFLPSNELLRKHKEQLNAMKIKTISFPFQTPDKVAMEICTDMGFLPMRSAVFMGQKWIYCSAPDREYQDRALDKAYKITNRYKETLALDERDKYRSMSDAELAETVQKRLNFFRKK